VTLLILMWSMASWSRFAKMARAGRAPPEPDVRLRPACWE